MQIEIPSDRQARCDDGPASPPSEDDTMDTEDHVDVDDEDIHAVANELFIPYPTIMNSIRQAAQRQQSSTSRIVSGGSYGVAPHSSLDGRTDTASLLRASGPRSQGITSVRVSIADLDDCDDDEFDDEDEGNHNMTEKEVADSYHPYIGSLRDAHHGRGSLLTSSSSLHHDSSGAPVVSSRSLESQPLRRPSGVSTTQQGGQLPRKKRLVQFADEIERVHVYEVDNSLFIRIEYSRPLFGWVLLLLAMVTGSVVDVLNTYVLATGPAQNIYAHMTWNSIGQAAIIVGLLLPAWYFLVKPTRVEARFLGTIQGAGLVLATGVLGALVSVSFTSAAHLMKQWRSMALCAVHAPLIVLFGKVFRNTVYREEVVGSGVLLVSFILSTFPTDLVSMKWEFAEMLSLSNGIYVASFLFLAVKARASRVSTPVVAALVSLLQLCVFFIICAVIGVSFSKEDQLNAVGSGDASSSFGGVEDSVFGFIQSQARASKWLASSICASVSLLAYLTTLRFIPPITVSVAMCLQQLASRFASFLVLFNSATAPWPVCPSSPSAPNIFFNTPTPAPLSQEGTLLCGNGGNTSILRNILFSVGSCVAVISGGYLVYVSSIKRSRVDRLLKHLKNRRVPKNPYQSRTSGTPKSPGASSSPSTDFVASSTLTHNVSERRGAILQFKRDRNIRHASLALSSSLPGSQTTTAQPPRRVANTPLPLRDPDNHSLTTIDPSTPTAVAKSLDRNE